MTKPVKEEIRNFWNENPVGSNFVTYEKGKEFYQKYDQFRYETEGHILKELDAINFEAKKVLEIGIGQGADSMQIAERGALYYGVDLTEESVRRVKERFKLFEKNWEEISVADARKLPYESGFFDVVYTHGVIHHSPKIRAIVSEIYRVLKPGGKAIAMVYHKNSVNYHLSIAIVRRLGLLVLALFPFMISIVRDVTGERKERIIKHIKALKSSGLSYLRMRNFIHKSTDGPDNVYSSVWSRKSIKLVFKGFSTIDTRVHFLNERHLLGFQYILPAFAKKKLAAKYGWHLWVVGIK